MEASRGVFHVMREAGYSTTKAKLLSSYADYRVGGTGDNEAKAIKGAVYKAWVLKCFPITYTKYGVSAINDDGSQGWPSTRPRTLRRDRRSHGRRSTGASTMIDVCRPYDPAPDPADPRNRALGSGTRRRH